MLCCGTCAGSLERQFRPAEIAKDLRRYRKKGPDPTTRRLRDGVLAAGASGTVLDIGAGIAALSLELVLAGCTRATAVDVVPAYVNAARSEAARRGRESALHYVTGDFVALASEIPPADVVVLDRVVCCYPQWEPLLRAAVAHARQIIAFSYPRDRWYVRLVVRLQNRARALLRRAFRTFVHPPGAMASVVEHAGFRRVSWRGDPVWAVEVYERRVAV